jgi:flavin reductase (DIM6/NTAB) family NADH-FMN oxidoreductase RutF
VDLGMSPDPISTVFHLYDPPVWLVTAVHAGRRGGLVATSAVRASIVPTRPRIAVGIARQHHTWELIEGSRCFALHLLAQDALETVWRFGLASGHYVDKFAGLPTLATPGGNPACPGTVAWLDCRVEDSLDIGDRTLYAAAVTGGGVTGNPPVLGVAALLRAAPPERRAQLDALYAADQAIDVAAIDAWRRVRSLV